MARIIFTRRMTGFTLILLACLLVAVVPRVAGQGDGPTLVQTGEYDIGLDCPVTAALDPAGTTLWVLMDNCFQSGYSIHAYQVADGARLEVDDYADALAMLDGVYVDLFITPMGFTPQGDLSIRYNDFDTYASTSVLIPVANGGEVTVHTSATYDALLAEYSLYPEYSVYSPDHTRVVASGDASFHIIDVQAEAEIVEIPAGGSTDYALASFSADNQHLYVVDTSGAADENDHTSTLFIYSLPDGTLLEQFTLPSSAIWVSPDETKAAVQLFSNNISDLSELLVVDLQSGLASPTSNLLEDPRPVLTCLNNGNDTSDLGYMTSGYMTLSNVQWLPDSANVVVSLSYNGEGAQGTGSICVFNNSRLRTYSVGG